MAATITYLTLGASDLDASVGFYDEVLKSLGWSQFTKHPGFVGYGADGAETGQTLWLCEPFDGGIATSGNGVMLAFGAESRAQVEAFHAAALAAGGTCEGAPGLRPNYTPTWYAAYVRDLTGNKLAVVFDASHAAAA